MFLEIVRSQGLAHLSYIVGDYGKAAVIDPRRDCQTYLDIAHREGARITHIFETHRNEDYVIGSKELAHFTGADICHGKHLPFKYGKPVSEGDTFQLGAIILTVLETPGHTYESISIVLADKGFGKEPVAVFTGDSLFIGDIGRTDFFPDKAEEVAGLLYDSIFKKLLPLGDQVILYPAHGPGSVCGTAIASRQFSSLGYERKDNPVVQITDRNEFIRYKLNEHHYYPPWFRMIEKYNLEGPPLLTRLPRPEPYNADEFARALDEGMFALDVRSPEASAGAYIPGSLAIPLEMIPAFAGWFLPYDKPIGLVVDVYQHVEMAVRCLIRLGYDNIMAYLTRGLQEWEIRGGEYDRILAVHAREIVRRINAKENFTLLDVRSEDEFKKGHLPTAINIYVSELPRQLDKVPRNRPITTFCGSGQRAIIAASMLKNNGFTDVEDCLGSMDACSAIGCPIVT